MKESCHISGIYRFETSPAMFADLERVYPAGLTDTGLKVELASDSPELRDVLAVLTKHGWQPRAHDEPYNTPMRFKMVRKRQYDDAELAKMPYLAAIPSYRLYDRSVSGRICHDHPTYRAGGKEDGPIQVDHRYLRRDVPIAYTEPSYTWVVLPDRSRREIERAGLTGPLFLDTALYEEHGDLEGIVSWEHAKERWWELSSSIVLPPMSPNMELYDKDGKRIVPGQIENGCYPSEGNYVRPELRYRRQDLERLGSFDLALTYEPFFARPLHSERRFIASQRFYQFCKEHNWPLEWVPVRLEE